MPNADFRKLIYARIKEDVNKCIEKIKHKIVSYGLQGHDFYIYVVPFTDIDKSRKDILREVIS